MHDRQRVRTLERIADLRPDPHDALGLHDPVGLEHLVERVAADELHHEIEQAVFALIEVEHRDGIRMRQPTRELRFAQEPLHDLGLGDEVRADDLDRDFATEAELLAAIHRAHATLTELLEDLIATVELPTEQRIDRYVDLDEARAVARAPIANLEIFLARRAIKLTRRARVGNRRAHPPKS